MTARVRLLVHLVRPAVLFLFVTYLAVGFTQAGGGQSPWSLALPVLAVTGFLMFSVAVNDLADERVDRVNLVGDRCRVLVSGSSSRHELVVMGAVSACVTPAAALLMGWRSLLVVVVGMVLSAGYSLPPTRLAARGAIAAVVLPACYVAVPYLLGVFAAAEAVTVADLGLLAGLYLGFMGRILLKDFRDMRGDALFGKRTFLVRHGRVATCRASSLLWTAGTVVILVTTRSTSAAYVLGLTALLVVALLLLRKLAEDRGRRRDDALVSALAIVGRGAMLLVLAHLGMANEGWPAPMAAAVTMILTALTLGQAHDMVRSGPRLVPWGAAETMAEAAASTARPRLSR